MKRTTIGLAAMVFAVAAATAPAAETAKDAILLVAPARVNVMQVAFDVANRYSTVMVSYQGKADSPKLHAWNGMEWLPLSLADYQSGAFLVTYPERVVFLGDDGLLPAAVKDVSAWCGQTVQFGDLETAALVNDLGRYLPFAPADWRWFAGRYNLTLENQNAAAAEAARKSSWYDEGGKPDDPAPGFFKYFTRSRRSTRANAKAAPVVVQPVDVAPGETVTVTETP